ncbi:hypothetical protein ACH35V_06745 [Actinomadura sp. 1N219]|uniref:hypothetical protein n=1 Tax=Actinomadura sp. 1N219 TaxID=3375152 RepID=UPI0037874EFB
MTLVLTVHNRETLWVVTDRRLSYSDRRPPIEDAIKVMDLETIDGRGLLAYAGLGATLLGTHPSDWMSAVLRGHGGLRFEQALGVLADAANRELPRHLATLPSGRRAHFILIPAFLRGIGFQLYSIDNIINANTGDHWYRYTRHVVPTQKGPISPRFGVTGSGGIYLKQRVKQWQRPLLSLLKSHDRGKISDLSIADSLARLNHEAHQAIQDGTVGPQCLVVWRRNMATRKPASGGGHQFYNGINRDGTPKPIPTIANGMDVQSLAGVVMAQFQAQTAAFFNDGAPFTFDTVEMDRLVGELPSEPDDKLR